jgi:phage terminase large subunit GpA-like protein
MDGSHYAIALSDVCSGYAALKPPLRVSVSQGAQSNLIIRQTGAAGGPWSPDETPYMVEPMDMLASRKHEAVAFAGPARTGKTAGLLLGWMAHTVVNDPGDMLFLQMSKDKAREFSKTDVDRAMRNSPALAALKSDRDIDSNTFDTMFRHGVWLRIAWPTVSNVSGSTYRYVAITDLDRIANAENVDGEGPLFNLALKRTTTFLSRGMCLAESSPGIEVADPNWTPATLHEAPPVTGILGIYNRSDRRRWYWKCPDCRSRFEAAPGVGLFNLPPDEQIIDEVRSANVGNMARHYAKVVCPCCGSVLEFKYRNMMNRRGIWVPDGQHLTDDDELVGDAPGSTIAGYWLGGVAAAYQTWNSLLERYFQGLRDYALTGSEETLKTTINTDQGMPYTPRHLVENSSKTRNPEDRANEDVERYIVPPWARCVMGSVDVQGGVNSRFVVQVHAIGPYQEQQLVDRFEIKLSTREGMGQEFAPIDPASYPEDWDVLTERLLRATWRTPTEGREIQMKLLVVDSGGEDGVTINAEAWWRRLRKIGMASRVRLYKGASSKTAPIIKESMVGKRKTTGKADIPLLLCNPNLLSDAVDAGLRRQTPGPGYIHFPAPKHPTKNPDGWLPQSFFDELKSEVRSKNGTWQQIRKRNETFDLCRMIRAGMLFLGLDKVKDWNLVPDWLAPLDQNALVIDAETRREMKENTPVATQVEKEVVVVPRRPKRARRAAASPYVR